MVRFIHEVAVMREVSHPNLVGFVGSVWEPRCATFVTPVWDDRLPHLPRNATLRKLATRKIAQPSTFRAALLL